MGAMDTVPEYVTVIAKRSTKATQNNHCRTMPAQNAVIQSAPGVLRPEFRRTPANASASRW